MSEKRQCLVCGCIKSPKETGKWRDFNFEQPMLKQTFRIIFTGDMNEYESATGIIQDYGFDIIKEEIFEE